MPGKLLHIEITPRQFREWCKDEWPDWFAEGMASMALDSKQKNARPVRVLAYQVFLRVRTGRSVPPTLQLWYNLYTIDGGRVPRSQPERVEIDRIMVKAAQDLFNMSQADAIRLVADGSDRRANSVEQNQYR